MKKIALLFFFLILFFLPKERTILTFLEIEDLKTVGHYRISFLTPFSSKNLETYFSSYDISEICLLFPSVLNQKRISNCYFFDFGSFSKNKKRIEKEYQILLEKNALFHDLAKEKLEGFYVESLSLEISYTELEKLLKEIPNLSYEIS